MTPLLAAVLFQTRPWTPPPTGLSKAFVDATAFLLAHGMGDPRGGEFREATLPKAYDENGRASIVHGWAFKGKKPYLVTTAGLVYDVAKVGPRLDVAKDVQAQKELHRLPEGGWYSNDDWDARYAAVLLVAGRADLAEGLVGSRVQGGPLEGFLGGWLSQAVQAHERGDDALALRAAQGVAQERNAFEIEFRRNASEPRTQSPFRFADLAVPLAEDAARRLAHPLPDLDLPALRRRPVADRAKALVQRLDEANGAGVRFDGTAVLGTDPLVQEIVALGDVAVEPLFDALAQDARLTRTVNQRTISGPPIYRLVPVREAAYAALQGILQVQNLPPATDLPALRAFWEANRALSPAERWFRLLGDDRASLFVWREAESSLFGDGNAFPRPNPLPAEALRATRDAALRDLLARRAKELAANWERRGESDFKLELALRLAKDLDLWAPAASLPSLQAVTDRAMSSDVSINSLGRPFAEAIVARGDREGAPAWRAYADWAQRARTAPGGIRTMEAFRPLLDRRNVPELRTAIAEVLTAPLSSWSIVQRSRSIREFSGLQTFLLSPLLDDPTFRQAVLASLGDATPVGSATIEGESMVVFEDDLDGHSSGSYGRSDGRTLLDDPLRPSPGQKVPVRACDQVATVLARLKGAPTFRPYWPKAKRDEAIVRLRTFLRRNAGRLEARLPAPGPFGED